jgi:hypothetical protein|tara:strand:+ start:755 stop:898 length:144 start_codon:yes stop_codon:yes gene_type:complete
MSKVTPATCVIAGTIVAQIADIWLSLSVLLVMGTLVLAAYHEFVEKP